MKGTRVVTMALEAEVAAYMASKNVRTGVKHFFRDMREETVKDMVSSVKIFHCTVGPGDFLFIPYAYLVCDKVHSDDVLGIRIPAVVTRDKTTMALISAEALKPSAPSNSMLKSIISLHECKL